MTCNDRNVYNGQSSSRKAGKAQDIKPSSDFMMLKVMHSGRQWLVGER